MLHFSALVVICWILAYTCNSLSIHVTINETSYNNTNSNNTQQYQQFTFSSQYSTVGRLPVTSISSHLIVLSIDDIDESQCTIQANVSNSVALLNITTLPTLKGCNTAETGKAAALSRMLYSHGALAAVIPATEKYMKGRMTGFILTDKVVPIAIVDKALTEFLVANKDSISIIQLPAATKEGFIVVMEAERLFRKKKYFTNGLYLRTVSFLSVLCGFIWLIIDPFGLEGYTSWCTSLLYYLSQGLYSISLLSVVRHWMQASSSCINCVQSPREISFISYFVSFLMLTASIWVGIEWHDGVFLIIYIICHLVAILVAVVGFIVFGKSFLTTFYKSGNRGSESMALPTKIAVFMIIFIVESTVIIVIYFTKPFGLFFEMFVTNLYIASAYYAIFLLLFFPKMEKKRQKRMVSRTPTFGDLRSINPKVSIELSEIARQV